MNLTRAVVLPKKYIKVREGLGKSGRMRGGNYYNHGLEFTLGEESRENIKEAKNSEKAVGSVPLSWVCR